MSRPRIGPIGLLSRPHALFAGAVSGGLLFLASLPGGLGPLAFVALAPLLRAIDAGVSPRRAALAGLICGLACYGLGFAWVLAVSGGGIVLWLAYVLGLSVLAAGTAAFAAALALLRRAGRGVALCAAPVLWAGLEIARGRGEFAISWLSLGYALADHLVLIRIAALGGIFLVSLWIVSVNAALAARALAPRQRAAVLAALLLPPLAYGLAPPAAPGGGPPLRIAAVQTDVAPSAQPFAERFAATLPTLLELSEEAVAGGADLVVWPETAFERPLGPWHDPWLAIVARDIGVPLLTGARRLEPGDPPRLFNTAVLVGPDGALRGEAGKAYPVPVYERAPQSAFSRELARRGLWRGRTWPVPEPGIVEAWGRDGVAVGAGVLVCMDSSFASAARALRRRGARLLIGIANDAVIGPWPSRQHARMARVRAVETASPFLHVANGGPTQWFDGHGRLVHELAAGGEAAGLAGLAPAGAPTLYTALGELPWLVAALLPPAGAALTRLRRRPAPPPRSAGLTLPSGAR